MPGTDAASAASVAGLRSGDTIVAINGEQVSGWNTLSTKIRSLGNSTAAITYLRDGQPTTVNVALPLVQRPKQSVDPPTPIKNLTPDQLENVGVLGITPIRPVSTAGPVAAVSKAGNQTVALFTGTFEAIKKFPEKVPKLWAAHQRPAA